jgi:LCP family protein required for cell wall assembly
MTAATTHRKPDRTVRKALLGLLACMLSLLLAAAAFLLYVQHHLSSQVDRIDGVFEGLHDRPARSTGRAADALNILLLGTDRRSDVPTTGSGAQSPSWIPGEQRSDAIMLLHIDADRRGASVISIPRDSWVDVPGHGSNKINAAFSLAGPSLAIQTVEQLTGVHIDHLAVIDWNGFRELTDSVGGVWVDVPRTVHDSARDITWTAGSHLLDGDQALAYVGQRYGLPGGDLDRVKRQQAYLRSLMEASLHTQMRSDPRMVYDFLDVVTRNLSVDSEWSSSSMTRLAFSLRSMRSASIGYLTAPVKGLGMEGAQSVVHLDRAAGAGLWAAVRADTLDEWEAEHADDLTGRRVS